MAGAFKIVALVMIVDLAAEVGAFAGKRPGHTVPVKKDKLGMYQHAICRRRGRYFNFPGLGWHAEADKSEQGIDQGEQPQAQQGAAVIANRVGWFW